MDVYKEDYEISKLVEPGYELSTVANICYFEFLNGHVGYAEKTIDRMAQETKRGNKGWLSGTTAVFSVKNLDHEDPDWIGPFLDNIEPFIDFLYFEGFKEFYFVTSPKNPFPRLVNDHLRQLRARLLSGEDFPTRLANVHASGTRFESTKPGYDIKVVLGVSEVA